MLNIVETVVLNKVLFYSYQPKKKTKYVTNKIWPKIQIKCVLKTFYSWRINRNFRLQNYGLINVYVKAGKKQIASNKCSTAEGSQCTTHMPTRWQSFPPQLQLMARVSSGDVISRLPPGEDKAAELTLHCSAHTKTLPSCMRCYGVAI